MATTWQRNLLANFDGLAANVNAALGGVGLVPLQDWLKAEPAVLRTTETPYAWVDLGGDMEFTEELDDLDGTILVDSTVEIGLVLAAATPGALRDTVADYGPTVVAAVEASHVAANVYTLGFHRGRLSPRFREKNRLFRVLLLEFEIQVHREEGAYEGDIMAGLGEVMALDRVSYEGVLYDVQRVAVNISALGDNEVIAAPGVGQKLVILAGYCSPAAGSITKIAMKMGATTVFPQTPVDIGGTSAPILSFSSFPLPFVEGGDNGAFAINLSAAVSVSGWVHYITVPV